MNLSKLWIVSWLMLSMFLTTSTAETHQKKARHSDTEIVWESNPLVTSWFGTVHRIRLDHDGVLAEWVVVKAGDKWDLKVDQITVKYLDPNHAHPVRKNFYPYERIRRGGQVRFKLPEPRRVIGISVKTSGWSGSHAKDGFRIFLKKNIQRPPVGWVRTDYFYGQCIGGHHCPGYRRKHLQKFSIDLQDVKNIKRIQFYSHDNVGSSHNAKISVYVDDERVAHHLNIKSRGAQHTIELGKVFGRYITFEATPHDEAVVQRIRVDYSDYLGEEGGRKHSNRHKSHEDHERREHDRRGGHSKDGGWGHFPKWPYN